MLVDLTPKNGVWIVPAADQADVPHTVALGCWLGDSPELQVVFSEGISILRPKEARLLAAALLAAADYADLCEVMGV